MSVALACAWKPRGELSRFLGHYPLLTDLYSEMFISLPPESPLEYRNKLREFAKVTIVQPSSWSAGRHSVVFSAVDRGNSFVHYVDFDRLLRWVEMFPDEIPKVVERIKQTDCLIVGRSERAFMTHADALKQTEHIVNFVFSRFLGQPVDLGGGSRGFSRRAVDFLKKHSSPDNAIGTDASWTVLLHRAGFNIQTMNVDGLTWEVPDHFERLSVQNQKDASFAEDYDQDASHWKQRVRTAFEILKAGFGALDQPLDE